MDTTLVRVFAQQFYGMDTRPELADALIGLMGDADLGTRLEATRSLRQWFYRTADMGLQRRIVAAYLARMAVPDEPVVRRALAEGMYVMLDENLGGGVSLQRTLAGINGLLGGGFVVEGVNDFAWLGVAHDDPGFVFDCVRVGF